MSVENEGETNDHWFDDHLTKWADLEFDITEISNYLEENHESATDAIMRVEFLVDASKALIERLSHSWLTRLDFTDGYFEEWVERLKNPMNYPEINQQYERWAKINRKWELILHSHQQDWDSVMMGENRRLILARCDSLDISSKPQLNLLFSLLSDPNSYQEIDAQLSLIEENEARQKRTVYSAIQDLIANGYDVNYISEMSLIDALKEISNRQNMHNQHEMIRLQIIDLLAGFDDNLAEKYEEQRKALINELDANVLHDLSEQIKAVSKDLRIRLSNVNTQIAEWMLSGINFETENIEANELLEWETNMPELTKQINTHLAIVNRFEYFDNRLEEVPSGAQYIGYLEHTEALADIVEQLELTWKEAELEAVSIIEKYQNLGLVLDDWNNRIIADPLSSLATIKFDELGWKKRIDYIHKLLDIDISFEGSLEVESRIALLKEIEAGDEVIEDTEHLIQRLITRGARHRRLLERELIELISLGKAAEDTMSSTFTLAEFEQFVAYARKHGSSSNISYTANSIISGEISERIKEKISHELAQFSAAGWYTDDLQTMFDNSPISVAKILASVRPQMKNHDALRRRLSAMPWNRNVSLALQLQEDMQNPLRLASINEQIPKLMTQLAKQSVEDENFSFTPWAPSPIRKTLLPIPEQITSPDDALGDAHEAMLEAMESNNQLDDDELFDAPKEQIKQQSDEMTGETGANAAIKIDEDELVADERNEAIEQEVIEKIPQLKSQQSAKIEEHSIEHLYIMMRKIGLDGDVDKSQSIADQIISIRKSIAKNVGIEPRDVRIDRLLRVVLRLLPQGNSEDEKRKLLIMKIFANIKRYENWVKLRLEARHKSAKGNLMVDSTTLGKALMRIPGPGFKVPLNKDEKPLPAINEIKELEVEVNALINSMNLESASGVIIAAE